MGRGERSIVRFEVGVWLKEGVVMAAHPGIFDCTTAHPEVQQHLQVPEAESTYVRMHVGSRDIGL